MDQQAMQAQFIQWLAKKTGAKNENELKQVIQKLQANKQMDQMVEQFKSEIGGGQEQSQQSTEAFLNGGKLAYLKCLSKFKKGGKVNCGCSPKPIQKAFLGAILGGAKDILKGGTSSVKGAQTMANISKGASMGIKALNVGKQLIEGSTATNNLQPKPIQTTNPQGGVGQIGMPSLTTQTMPTFQVGMMSSPQEVTGGQVLYQGNSNAVGKNPNSNPMINTGITKYQENGGKLKPKKIK